MYTYKRRKKISYKNKRGRYVQRSKFKSGFRNYGLIRYLRNKFLLSKPELKRHYDQYTENTINTTPAIQNLNIIDQGNAVTQRLGNQIKIMAHYFNALFSINASATNTKIRLMIVLDKQVNESTMTIGDLLRDTSADDVLVSSMELDNSQRFRILFDQLIVLSQEFPSKSIKYYKKHNLPIKYDANTSAVADQTSKALYMIVFSNESTNTPTITASSCIRFVDN